jgi:hypothetical protein
VTCQYCGAEESQGIRNAAGFTCMPCWNAGQRREQEEGMELALLVAKCPRCPGWFTLCEPCAPEDRQACEERVTFSVNLHIACPYCGRGYRPAEVTKRWVSFPAPEEEG